MLTQSTGSEPEAREARTWWLYGAAVLSGMVVIAYLAVWARRYGLDLRVYRDSATAWLDGHDPYSSTFTPSRLAFTYPPFALGVLSVLTVASFAVTQWLLWGASVAAATAAVVIVLRDRGFTGGLGLWCGSFAWACVATVALEPVRSGMNYGQIEFVLLFMVVADVLVVPAPVRGVLIGIAGAVKLTPLAFVVVFLVDRDWRSGVRATVSFVLCTGAAWLFRPELSRVFWNDDVRHPARVGTVAYAGNQSWFAVLHRPPFAGAAGGWAWIALSLVTVLVGTFVAWRSVHTGQRSLAVVAIALVGLLVSPISWTHHWVWVLLIPPVLIGPRRHRMEPVTRAMLWGIVGITMAAPYWWIGSGPAADALEAVLPLWTFATLVLWAGADYTCWRRSTSPSGTRAADPAVIP